MGDCRRQRAGKNDLKRTTDIHIDGQRGTDIKAEGE